MNYIKLLNTIGKLAKEGQIKSVDEAIQMVQQMGAKVDGLLKQGIENLFKTTKARDPDAFKGWTPEVIEGGKSPKKWTDKSGQQWIQDGDGPPIQITEGIGIFDTPYKRMKFDADIKRKIEGGKGKEGVENLFKETKKVDLPEGVNWKDTPLPVNPKVESFYDELVENAYKESKKTGRDVKTIIEETIGYKFTGDETGKEILDIVEEKFFKADGGRIGFKSGGRKDRMGGTMEQTAQELREAAPDQFGGGMNIDHGGGRDDPPPVETRGGKLNISPVVTYGGPYDQIENVGFRGNIGKLMAAGLINLEDAITTGNIDPAFAANLNLGNFNVGGIKDQDQTGIFAQGNIGPVNVGGTYQDLGEYGTSKNIGASSQLGNLGIGVNYDFESNPNVGVNYNDPDSGWSGGVSYNFEGKPEGRIELKKTFKKGGRVGYDAGGLTGQAKNIYDSWIDAGHSEEDVLAYLQSRGLYNPEDVGITSIVNTQQPIIPGGGGGDGSPPGPTFRRDDNLGTSDYQGTGPGFWESILGIPAALIEGYTKVSPMINFAKNIFKPRVQNYVTNPNLDAIAKADEQRKAKAEAERAAFLAEQQRTNITSQLGGPDGQSGGKYVGGDAFASANPYGGSGTKDDMGADTFYKKGGLATMFTRRR